MEVTVLFFGQLKEITGQASLVLPHMADTQSLVTLLKNRFPALDNISFVLAVNKQIIQHNTGLETGATVALMPAFSGG